MEKTMAKSWAVLPVVAAVLALAGCGGSGNNDSDVPSTSTTAGSIIACFTADNTVSFSVTASNVPANSLAANRSTVGPMTYNGQVVTGQTYFYPNGNTTYTQTSYWTVNNSGITMGDTVTNTTNTTVEPDGTFLPQNMSPGQTATNSSNQVTTFVGFETLSLAGQTFTNTCHMQGVDPQGNQVDGWYAPGYGVIQAVYSSGEIVQYNGNL